MADIQEKYAIMMEKYCFFVPEDCLQRRITLKRKKDPRQILCALTKLHVAWSNTFFQLLFSYSEQRKIAEKATGLDNTSKQFICSGLCTNKINRIILLQECSDSSKYPYPNASSSNFSIDFANFKVLKSACPQKSKG